MMPIRPLCGESEVILPIKFSHSSPGWSVHRGSFSSRSQNPGSRYSGKPGFSYEHIWIGLRHLRAAFSKIHSNYIALRFQSARSNKFASKWPRSWSETNWKRFQRSWRWILREKQLRGYRRKFSSILEIRGQCSLCSLAVRLFGLVGTRGEAEMNRLPGWPAFFIVAPNTYFDNPMTGFVNAKSIKGGNREKYKQ